jgi:alpha-acetolactate decarboxylase
MSTPANLKDIIEALGFQMDETFQYLNRETGEIVTATSEELQAAETGAMDDYPEWQHDNIELAKQIITDAEGKFVELPSKFEINEYEIMESFCYSITDQKISNELAYAIKGSGAFRRFKDRIYESGIEQQWYKYRDEALGEIAKEWCQRHQIAYV